MASISPFTMLPRYCFTAWRLDPVAEHEAERTELREWTLSSLAEGFLRYQLSIEGYERHFGATTLASTAIGNMIEALIMSEAPHEDMEVITTTASYAVFHQFLNDPRLPYLFLRSFASRTQAFHSNGQSLIDIDEAVIRHELYVRSLDPAERSDRYLMILEGLLTVVSSATRFSTGKRMVVMTRKDPPLGGFEVLDDLRPKKLGLQANRVTFASTFKRITKGILDGLDWKNVLVAGGIVLTTLLHTDPAEDETTRIQNPDIDIFLYGVDAEQANRKVEEIHEIWSRNLPRTASRLVTRNVRTIELLAEYPNRRLQIILKLAPTLLDVLLNFDLDACAIGFTGSDVIMLPRCARAMETGYNTFTMDLIWGHYLGRRRETRIERVLKYADRGFGLRILPSFAKSLQSKDVEPTCTLPSGTALPTSDERWPHHLHRMASPEEPGLKSLRRIAHVARSYVKWLFFRTRARQCALPDFAPASVPMITLYELTKDEYDSRSHIIHSMGLRNFETFLRCCEVWRLEKQGRVG